MPLDAGAMAEDVVRDYLDGPRVFPRQGFREPHGASTRAGQSIGSTAVSANTPGCAPPPPPPPPPSNTCSAYTTSFISVSEWTTESSDCDTGSGGGTTVGNGITCYGEYLYLEINRWDGRGWIVIWEGWGTVCY